MTGTAERPFGSHRTMPPTLGASTLVDLLRALYCGSRPPAIMGVLNVTPDSFSDGGLFVDPRAALDHALGMIDQGADIIDVGPESTRPGSDPVPSEEQLARAIPVIAGLRRARPEAPISIDTRDAGVARAAIEAGAGLVNDISALSADRDMAQVVVETGVGVVLMHLPGTPRTMQTAVGGPVYDDVVGAVTDYLRQRVEFAVSRGIPRQRIIVDPGLGFGKTVEHNLQLMRRLAELSGLGVPVLVGASRKSFIGQVTGVDTPADRLPGSLACAAVAVLAGAAIIRVHDVPQTRPVILMADAIRKAQRA